jgi:hypothetical protein
MHFLPYFFERSLTSCSENIVMSTPIANATARLASATSQMRKASAELIAATGEALSCVGVIAEGMVREAVSTWQPPIEASLPRLRNRVINLRADLIVLNQNLVRAVAAKESKARQLRALRNSVTERAYTDACSVVTGIERCIAEVQVDLRPAEELFGSAEAEWRKVRDSRRQREIALLREGLAGA